MISKLTINRTELQLIFTEVEPMQPRFFHKLVDGNFFWKQTLTIFLKTTIIAPWGGVDRIRSRLKIIDECLQVVRTLLKVPALLVAAGLIMKNTDNQIAIDIFATAGGILQHTLCLRKEYECLLGHLKINFILGFIIEFANSMHKFFWVRSEVQWL